MLFECRLRPTIEFIIRREKVVVNSLGIMRAILFFDGYYYVFDLTEVICDNSNRNYQDFQIYKLNALEDFVDDILEWKTDPDRLLGVVAVNSLNHTEQPANYMSYMSNDRVIFSEYVEVGFEEGVPMEVLYVNPKAEGLFSYISIPSREIPNCIPSWFRSEIKEIRNWSLYE